MFAVAEAVMQERFCCFCDDLSGDVISEVAGRAEVVGDTGGGC
jgi:hypothetical protein